MKLHLGCGERYLEGYLNIDHPPAEHTVQSASVADLHANIATLSFPTGSIQEIRLHHVFEHFTRPMACALLSAWHMWLREGGTLHIEVPDFSRTATVLINPFRSLRRKLVAERHLYGSHEAKWAAHYEGYTTATLKALLKSFGFQLSNVSRNSWRGTYNIEVVAKKIRDDLTKKDYEHLAAKYLGNYLLDSSETEQRLLQTWLSDYKKHFEILAAKCG